VVARTIGDPRAIAGSIRSEIRAIDPEMPVPQFLSMEEIVDSSVSQRRFQLQLILLFGIASLLLSTMGVYGVVAFAVSQRTSEMGLRMVLGAKASNVQAMVWRQGMRPVALGIGAGLITALAISRLLTNLLFGVHGRPNDIWIGGSDRGGGYRSGMLHSGATGYPRRSGDCDAVRMICQ
jgi:ABC-type antimicrobial peptide transport system permease subunit